MRHCATFATLHNQRQTPKQNEAQQGNTALRACGAAAACADEGATPDYSPGQTTTQDSPATSARATRGKAEAIARLFAPYRVTDESGGNKAAEAVPEVSSVSFYVADGDTLLYAFNYGEDKGYTIVNADLSGFPILANSEDGAIDFNSMDDASPFKSFVGRAAEAVRRNLLTSAPDTSKVETWANIIHTAMRNIRVHRVRRLVRMFQTQRGAAL